MDFASIPLSAVLHQALAEEGYTTPTPIQAKAIPPILEGRDMLGCAQTGTGKTAAFALPILHRLMNATVDKTKRGPKLPRALVLSPTRELATQIAESFQTYGRYTNMTGTVVFGGVSQFHQVKALQRGIDILVATPGRLMDLGYINLSAIEVFVLDEADRMLDMGFIQPIRQISKSLPAKKQTLLFSATMPKEIVHLAESLLRDPVRVSVTPVGSTVQLIEQSVYMVPRFKKQSLLHHLIGEHKIQRAVVFTRTKHGADKVAQKLLRAGITAEAIHGNKAQNKRQRSLDAFKSGQARILVATDVAARGLDVDGITHVFNFDLPNEPEAYVHRIGRTGRAGAKGIAMSFCDSDERFFLKQIERLTGKALPQVTKLPELQEIVEPKAMFFANPPHGHGDHEAIDGGRQRATRTGYKPDTYRGQGGSRGGAGHNGGGGYVSGHSHNNGGGGGNSAPRRNEFLTSGGPTGNTNGGGGGAPRPSGPGIKPGMFARGGKGAPRRPAF
jgi:ATP-dependent RNA helicase RhlE